MSETQPLVSIIIPNYNNEKYIEAAICSVQNQTYPHIEIIVVNDGSTDNSLEKIQKLEAADPRIQCINQPNKGTNLTRKTGIDAAQGKYVQYLDADDTLLPDAIERLVARAEASGADIVSAPFFFEYEDGRKISSPVLEEDEIGGIEYFRAIFEWRGATWSMSGNFQRRSLIYDHNIDILTNVPFGQDATWMIQLFFHTSRIVSLKTPIFNYRQNPSSVTYSKAAERKRIQGGQVLYHWLYEFLDKKGLLNEFSKELSIMQKNMTFASIYALPFDEVRDNLKIAVKNIGRHPELRLRLSRKKQLFLQLFQYSPILCRLWIQCMKFRNSRNKTV